MGVSVLACVRACGMANIFVAEDDCGSRVRYNDNVRLHSSDLLQMSPSRGQLHCFCVSEVAPFRFM